MRNWESDRKLTQVSLIVGFIAWIVGVILFLTTKSRPGSDLPWVVAGSTLFVSGVVLAVGGYLGRLIVDLHPTAPPAEVEPEKVVPPQEPALSGEPTPAEEATGSVEAPPAGT
jgi:hypothetical protein